MEISIIVACDKNWSIGKKGKLPWNHFKDDMRIFKDLTTSTQNPGVVMGRKTWESIPTIHRPLCDRFNIVLSSTTDEIEGAVVAKNIESVMATAKKAGVDKLWVIGGCKLYEDFMGIATEVYITKIDHTFEDCDVVFPHMDLNEFYTMVQERSYKSISFPHLFTLQHWKWLSNNI